MYAIRITKNFFGPKTVKSYVAGNILNEDIRSEFRFRAEADAIVKLLDAEVYHTSHNESGRPEYRVVRVKVSH